MPRFNIAAVPIDSERWKDFFCAAESLRSRADGYLLSPDKALPHVTLCQFQAPSERDAWQHIQEYVGRDIMIKTGGIYIDKAEDEKSAPKFWLGYIVRYNIELIAVQTEIVGRLQKAFKEIVTKSGENYFPHFTIARIAEVVPELDEEKIFNNCLIKTSFPCRLQLGLSDENGQFLQILDGSL